MRQAGCDTTWNINPALFDRGIRTHGRIMPSCTRILFTLFKHRTNTRFTVSEADIIAGSAFASAGIVINRGRGVIGRLLSGPGVGRRQRFTTGHRSLCCFSPEDLEPRRVACSGGRRRFAGPESPSTPFACPSDPAQSSGRCEGKLRKWDHNGTRDPSSPVSDLLCRRSHCSSSTCPFRLGCVAVLT